MLSILAIRSEGRILFAAFMASVPGRKRTNWLVKGLTVTLRLLWLLGSKWYSEHTERPSLWRHVEKSHPRGGTKGPQTPQKEQVYSAFSAIRPLEAR